jgi:hypothetical protein
MLQESYPLYLAGEPQTPHLDLAVTGGAACSSIASPPSWRT